MHVGRLFFLVLSHVQIYLEKSWISTGSLDIIMWSSILDLLALSCWTQVKQTFQYRHWSSLECHHISGSKTRSEVHFQHRQNYINDKYDLPWRYFYICHIQFQVYEFFNLCFQNSMYFSFILPTIVFVGWLIMSASMFVWWQVVPRQMYHM